MYSGCIHIFVHTYTHSDQRKRGYQFKIWGILKGLHGGRGTEN